VDTGLILNNEQTSGVAACPLLIAELDLLFCSYVASLNLSHPIIDSSSGTATRLSPIQAGFYI